MKEQITWSLIQSTTLPLLRNYSSRYFLYKRIIDVALATAVLVILLPLLLCIAILIKIDSPGPILFVQKRVTVRRRIKDGHIYWEPYTFNFYKFRTMWTNVDQKLHQQFMAAYISGDQARMADLQPDPKVATSFKLAGDPRVTKLGKFLRQSSLDEFPQLWNVIKGEISLVGPRPPIPYEVEMYTLEHFRRLATIPGITGLWQVSGRCELSFNDMLQLDMKYIENQSLILDLKIIVLTAVAVISQRGAK